MNKNQGFSFIEVLITLVLTTIGVLGMVALQGRSIQYIHDATNRNTAQTLSNEIVEIIRLNRSEILNGEKKSIIFTGYKDTSIFFKASNQNFSQSPITSVTATTCNTPSNSATEQRNCWLTKVRQQLPGANELFTPNFYICQSSAPGQCDGKGSILEIQLAWQVSDGACIDPNAPNESTCILRTRVEL